MREDEGRKICARADLKNTKGIVAKAAPPPSEAHSACSLKQQQYHQHRLDERSAVYRAARFHDRGMGARADQSEQMIGEMEQHVASNEGCGYPCAMRQAPGG